MPASFEPTKRAWKSGGEDDGSIHAMGNGELVAYGRGPDLPYLYGPPYSSPRILSLLTVCPGGVKDEAVREPGTAVWRHEFSLRGRPVLSFTEFVAAGVNAYIRLYRIAEAGIGWRLAPHPAAAVTECAGKWGTWLLSLEAGQAIFRYPCTFPSFHWVMAAGSCHIEPDGRDLVLRCEPGEGGLAIVGAASYPAGRRQAETVASLGSGAFLEPTRNYWRIFTERRQGAMPRIALPPKAAETADSVAVLIKAQTSAGGGVIAGHHYAFAAPRDQYGTARGMLGLGMLEEARWNLVFRRRKHELFGTLANGDMMGTDCARHVHENDEVEITGYTILQVRDYLRAGGERELAADLWPMLSWCWEAQLKNLAGGLLPFNGDETYVAGGFFPRSGLLQGSADATLVFVEAGKWLAEWAQKQGFWAAERAETARAAVAEAQAAYRRCFWAGDRLWANEPARLDHIQPPRFRHGVCEGWQGGRCRWFGWTERDANGRYTCPSCRARTDLVPEEPPRTVVNSVALLPVYLGSEVLAPGELGRLADGILAQASSGGHIPSVPGSSGCVGYDPGLLLTTLTKIGHPAAAAACERLLGMVDSAGAWSEYYDGLDRARAGCCRARPWESGINIGAMLGFFAQGVGK